MAASVRVRIVASEAESLAFSSSSSALRLVSASAASSFRVVCAMSRALPWASRRAVSKATPAASASAFIACAWSRSARRRSARACRIDWIRGSAILSIR